MFARVLSSSMDQRSLVFKAVHVGQGAEEVFAAGMLTNLQAAVISLTVFDRNSLETHAAGINW
jgi:hypothetical protein